MNDFTYLYVHACAFMVVYAGVGQQRVLELKLKLQEVASFPLWLLGLELWSCEGAASTLNYQGFFLASSFSILHNKLLYGMLRSYCCHFSELYAIGTKHECKHQGLQSICRDRIQDVYPRLLILRKEQACSPHRWMHRRLQFKREASYLILFVEELGVGTHINWQCRKSKPPSEFQSW